MIKHKINIIIKNKPYLIYKKFVSKAASELLKKVLNELKIKSHKSFELSIMLVSNDTIKKLNDDYRKKDKITNVLSFPSNDLDYKILNTLSFDDNYYLGDIAIATDVIKKEAKEQKLDFSYHLSHMIIHSILHLFSFDHLNDEDESAMFEIENKILDLLIKA